MSSEIAVRARGLSKSYRLYDRPSDRLKQMLFRGRRQYGRVFHALSGVDFELRRGEALGLVGRNGAGKSTLLQLVCGTLTPTSGSIEVNGRVAALLELGAGFNPEFSGRENVYLSASVMGLSTSEIDARYEDIVEFSGVRDFIDQPVKIYSSGMYVRLAFAIATSIDPDILVIDEALSVGDGAFARKSFDRIAQLREKGVTILFCSHSMYHVEAICDRAIWLDHGQAMMMGAPADVVAAFDQALLAAEHAAETGQEAPKPASAPAGTARLAGVQVWDGEKWGRQASLQSLKDDLRLRVAFTSDPSLPPPTLAISIDTVDRRTVSSAGSLYDQQVLERDADGRGEVDIVFPHLPLMRGAYLVTVYLACEDMIHIYDTAPDYLEIDVQQDGLERGVAWLPHRWESPADAAAPARVTCDQ